MILDTLVGMLIVRKLGTKYGMRLSIIERTELGSLNNTEIVLLV